MVTITPISTESTFENRVQQPPVSEVTAQNTASGEVTEARRPNSSSGLFAEGSNLARSAWPGRGDGPQRASADAPDEFGAVSQSDAEPDRSGRSHMGAQDRPHRTFTQPFDYTSSDEIFAEVARQAHQQMVENTNLAMAQSAQQHQQELLNRTLEHHRALQNNARKQANDHLGDAITQMKQATSELSQKAAAG